MSVNAMRSIWEEDAVKPEKLQDFDSYEIRIEHTSHGWLAWAEDHWSDWAGVIGWGESRKEAIADLKHQLKEHEE